MTHIEYVTLTLKFSFRMANAVGLTESRGAAALGGLDSEEHRRLRNTAYVKLTRQEQRKLR